MTTAASDRFRIRSPQRLPLHGRRRHLGYGFAFTLLGACCWSLGGFFVRATDGVDAWQIIFYRSWVVLVLMSLAMALHHRRRLPAVLRDAGLNAAIAGVALGLAGLTFVMALFYTTVAQAIFMVGIAPFTAALLGRWILGERVHGSTWIAMFIALAGLAVMVWGSTGGGFTGAILALYSAFCFSCYSVLLRWGQKTDMTASIVWNGAFLILFSTAVLLVPTPLRDHAGAEAFAVGWQNFLIIVAMGAVQLSLGLALFTRGSKTVPAAELALLSLAEPMLSPVWVWLAFDEVPSASTLVGGAVILVALVFRIFAMAGGGRPERVRRER
ncbi:MAG TPA: DMT family transporter [Aestuariivirgaceae bacterium]|nr:DMT family transporter [Aestuariivirgaceae bacterium]